MFSHISWPSTVFGEGLGIGGKIVHTTYKYFCYVECEHFSCKMLIIYMFPTLFLQLIHVCTLDVQGIQSSYTYYIVLTMGRHHCWPCTVCI